jgi:hypothetical protein
MEAQRMNFSECWKLIFDEVTEFPDLIKQLQADFPDTFGSKSDLEIDLAWSFFSEEVYGVGCMLYSKPSALAFIDWVSSQGDVERRRRFIVAERARRESKT